MRLILTAFPGMGAARKISTGLVKEGLAACATMWPARSTYVWKGKVVNSEEAVVLYKTTRGKVRGLRVELKRRHPYEVPEILEWDVPGGDVDYLRWLEAAVAKKPRVAGARPPKPARR